MFYFAQFILDTEITIGGYIDRDRLEWAGEDLACKEFGLLPHLRTPLDSFASEFKELHDFSTVEHWIIVEGDAERSFLERLGELRFYTFHISRIEQYGGKGNVKPGKFKLHLESLCDRGYLPSLQGDLDTGSRNRFRSLVSSGLVEEELVFPFTKDFEGSFPAPILHRALDLLGYNVDLDWLADRMTSRSNIQPIVNVIEAKLGQQISKIELGYKLAEVVQYNWVWIYEKYNDSEIVKWLSFVRTGKIT